MSLEHDPRPRFDLEAAFSAGIVMQEIIDETHQFTSPIVIDDFLLQARRGEMNDSFLIEHAVMAADRLAVTQMQIDAEDRYFRDLAPDTKKLAGVLSYAATLTNCTAAMREMDMLDADMDEETLAAIAETANEALVQAVQAEAPAVKPGFGDMHIRAMRTSLQEGAELLMHVHPDSPYRSMLSEKFAANKFSIAATIAIRGSLALSRAGFNDRPPSSWGAGAP